MLETTEVIDEAVEVYLKEPVDVVELSTGISLAELCHRELLRRNFVDTPMEERTAFELRVIEAEEGLAFFLDQHERQVKGTANPHNMIVPHLLGITNEFDPYTPPPFATGDVSKICLPRLVETSIDVSQPSIVAPERESVIESFSQETMEAEFQTEATMPYPESARRPNQMRGLDQLLQTRLRRQKLESQVIEAAKKAASTIAETIGQRIEFSKFGDQDDANYLIAESGGEWHLMFVVGDQHRSHTHWEYQECQRFAIHVVNGLVENMSRVLNDQIDEEERAIDGFTTPESNIPLHVDGSGIDDDPVDLARFLQCIECGTVYPPHHLPQAVSKCPTCGKSKTLVPVTSLPGGKPIVGRSTSSNRR